MKDISLREIRKEDLQLYYKWSQSPDEYDEPSSYSFEDIQKEFENTKFLSEKKGELLIIYKDKTPIGTVEYSQHPTDKWIFWCSIAIEVPKMRGKGYGTEAQIQLVDYVFKRFPKVYKIEMWTDVENIAEKKALSKAGFIHEGTLRARNRLYGNFRDMEVYGFLRTEWQEKKCKNP